MDFNLKLDIDPNDNYQKAVKDWIQFQQSFNNLTPQDKNRFMIELRDSIMTSYIFGLFQQY